MTVELIESPPEAYLAGYATIHEVPADVLAHRVVGQMILAKGNLNKYKAILTLLIQDLRSAAPDAEKEPG